MLTFRQIEAFKAIMDAGTIKRAAELMHLSQPAVSRLLSDLESNLGFGLFERRKGRILALREAHELHAEVERSFVGMDRIAEAADRIGRQRKTRLRIAVLPSFTMGPLPSVIGKLMNNNPGLYVSLENRTRTQIVEGVADGRYDIGLASVPIQTSNVSVTPLMRSEVVCLTPAQHPLAGRRVITPTDLEDVPIILGTERAPMRVALDHLLLEVGARCERRLSVNSLRMACALVAQGVGITFLVSWFFTDAAMPGTRIVPFEPVISVEFAALFQSGQPLDGVAAKFVAAFREAAQQGANAAVFPD